LSAFTIELCFKCIGRIEGKQPYGHEIDVLYSELSVEAQRGIEELYDRILKTDRVFIEATKIATPSYFDLRAMLKRSSDAFVLWRYAYEKPDIGMDPCKACQRASISYILQIRPTWFPLAARVSGQPTCQVR
jgi:hypothetical protein